LDNWATPPFVGVGVAKAGVRPVAISAVEAGARALARDALVAECRAGTAGCKNARLPMQSRLGRPRTKAPPATSAA
jgi:hypothetical protein